MVKGRTLVSPPPPWVRAWVRARVDPPIPAGKVLPLYLCIPYTHERVCRRERSVRGRGCISFK